MNEKKQDYIFLNDAIFIPAIAGIVVNVCINKIIVFLFSLGIFFSLVYSSSLKKKKRTFFWALFNFLGFFIFFNWYSSYYSHKKITRLDKIYDKKSCKGFIFDKEVDKNKKYFIYSITDQGEWIKIKSKNNYGLLSSVSIKNIFWHTPSLLNQTDSLPRSTFILSGTSNYFMGHTNTTLMITSFLNYLYRIRSDIVTQASLHLEEETALLFKSIFLGHSPTKIGSPKALFLSNILKEWGIAHYLARSGLHLVIINKFFIFLGGLIGIRIIILYYLFFIFIVFFLIVSLGATPFYRALFLWVGVKGAEVFLKIQIPYKTMLSLITLFFLLYNPLVIYNLSFELSFIITFILALFS